MASSKIDPQLQDSFFQEVSGIVDHNETDAGVRKAVGIATVATILEIVVTALKTLGQSCNASPDQVAKSSKNPTPVQQVRLKAAIRRAARQAKRDGKPGADADGVVDTAFVAALRSGKKNPEAVARQYASSIGG